MISYIESDKTNAYRHFDHCNRCSGVDETGTTSVISTSLYTKLDYEKNSSSFPEAN